MSGLAGRYHSYNLPVSSNMDTIMSTHVFAVTERQKDPTRRTQVSQASSNEVSQIFGRLRFEIFYIYSSYVLFQ